MKMHREPTIAVVGEKWPGDHRMLLVPDHVSLLSEAGCRVLVESGAGTGIGIQDSEYEAAGATLHDTGYCYGNAHLVVKYKSPHPTEYRYLRPGSRIACFVYLEHDREMTETFCEKQVDIYGLTYFRTPDGFFPLPVSDNELTGKMAVIYGAYFLQSHLGGRGVYLGHAPGAANPRVLVIGYGKSGGAAARTALALGADVTVLGTSAERLRLFEGTLDRPVRALVNTPENLRQELKEADLVVGAILDSTVDTPAMIDRSMLSCMRKGSVIIDVTCGYGAGYLPTFHSFTSHENPSYEVDGVIHIKIDRLPSTVPVTASAATGQSAYLTC
ncbi:hypothetical protein PYH37_000048 [Sinorhizobium numidicum]|uniref:Alanine dehydrogenase n=1 Tax=Sinorhizobium numidicum TaxID=680248 RepID=A0ABY8CQ61_9HYPH|nr:NAD(P)-dependent oxidoreductase [Sinorhizobium numidicum]WEX74776.1 hypothetical protein PYH37_000048 [Sinorhizobium numidicum]WEX80769.1 hypothetical protein PYH38_000050 [Sinorhizobium numidicum]